MISNNETKLNRKLRWLGLREQIILLGSSTKVTDEALTGSYLRPIEIEELIKRDIKQSLGDSAAEYATFVSERDIAYRATDIRGHLGVVPDVQELIESIDKLIDTAYARGLEDGAAKREIHDGNTISGEWS